MAHTAQAMKVQSTKRVGRAKAAKHENKEVFAFFKTTRLQACEKLFRKIEGRTALVEGKHDVQSLEAVGVKAAFVEANGKTEKIVERLEKTSPERRVILLLDFDAEGLRKQGFFKTLLEEKGFAVDALYARKLRALLGFTHVEEIESKYLKLKEKGEMHGKNVR